MPNTRFRRCAQVIARRFPSGLRGSSLAVTSAGAASVAGRLPRPDSVSCDGSLALGAKTPWKRARWARGGGTSAAVLVLLCGLLLFLAVHSILELAPRLRGAGIAEWGLGSWKAIYGLLSIAGFVLIVHGYGLAHSEAVLLSSPPPLWLRHFAALFTLPAFILLAATYMPNNHFKTRLSHPLLLAVKLWALGRLLAVGWRHAVPTMAAFVAWAVIALAAARRRDRAAGT